jgi:hypothetical protein
MATTEGGRPLKHFAMTLGKVGMFCLNWNTHDWREHGFMAEPECSFCGRTKQEVNQLITGARAFICDACVQLCLVMLSEQHSQRTSRDLVGGLGELGVAITD